jgi:hypothetical protein
MRKPGAQCMRDASCKTAAISQSAPIVIPSTAGIRNYSRENVNPESQILLTHENEIQGRIRILAVAVNKEK